jgi:hypothetical protein
VCLGGRKKKWKKNKKNNNIFSQMDIIRGNYVQRKEFAEKFIALIISFLVGERKKQLNSLINRLKWQAGEVEIFQNTNERAIFQR